MARFDPNFTVYIDPWPWHILPVDLEVSKALLRAAAQEGGGSPSFLSLAANTGNEELVRAVLAAFPEGPRQWAYGPAASPVRVAMQRLNNRLWQVREARRQPAVRCRPSS